MARARSKRAAARPAKHGRARAAAVRAVVAEPWQRDATVRRLTAEILAIDRREGRALVSAYLEIGRRLIAARDRLQHGDWQAWITAELPYGTRTAQRYVELTLWADSHRGELRRLQHLGLTKLLRLSALDPKLRARLPVSEPIPIPGTGVEKPLVAMTVGELDHVIGNLTAGPVDVQPPGQILAALRRRVAAVEAWAETAIARADELDATEIADVRHDLQTVLDELDATFG